MALEVESGVRWFSSSTRPGRRSVQLMMDGCLPNLACELPLKLPEIARGPTSYRWRFQCRLRPIADISCAVRLRSSQRGHACEPSGSDRTSEPSYFEFCLARCSLCISIGSSRFFLAGCLHGGMVSCAAATPL